MSIALSSLLAHEHQGWMCRPLKHFIVTLLIEMVNNKYGIKVDKQYKLPKMRYKGDKPVQQLLRKTAPALIQEVSHAAVSHVTVVGPKVGSAGLAGLSRRYHVLLACMVVCKHCMCLQGCMCAVLTELLHPSTPCLTLMLVQGSCCEQVEPADREASFPLRTGKPSKKGQPAASKHLQSSSQASKPARAAPATEQNGKGPLKSAAGGSSSSMPPEIAAALGRGQTDGKEIHLDIRSARTPAEMHSAWS